jgi:hypothetical protein
MTSMTYPPPPPPPPSWGKTSTIAASTGSRMPKRFEYKSIRLDFKGRGITQEINILDIDGKRVKGWGSSANVPTLPEMLSALGEDGWELVSHVVNQDNVTNGITFHYYTFKRELQ